jgi:hypothetical protein
MLSAVRIRWCHARAGGRGTITLFAVVLAAGCTVRANPTAPLAPAEGSHPANVISVSFVQEQRERSTTGIAMVHRQVIVEIVEGAPAGDGDHLVASMLSVQLADADTLFSQTSWHQGAHALTIVSRPDCTPRDAPVPSAPRVSVVVEDATGPLADPVGAGYRQVATDTYERNDGPAITRVSHVHDLGQRRVETLDARTREVMAIRTGFVIDRSRSLIPAKVRALRCVPTTQ